MLIAPLDWGLGHATRCIPIIRQLQQQNIEVIVAAEEKIALILSEAFPGIRILPLKGYRIRYSRDKKFFSFKILLQLPKLLLAIRHEKKWLKSVIAQYHISAVISDNRFGLYNKSVPCVFITHQLHIKSGFSIIDAIIQKLNYKLVNCFQECWVPDLEGINNLAGELSHPHLLPDVPVKYLGVLSRLTKTNYSEKYVVAIILSGPEPQRTIFEKIILNQIDGLEEPMVLVRGLPDEKTSLKHPHVNLTVFNHLGADALSSIMQQSEVILARSGYSTIMDLMSIGKKSILVPTPGQTEQEYLADYLFKKHLCITVSQEKFRLQETLTRASSFDYHIPENVNYNEAILSKWLKQLK